MVKGTYECGPWELSDDEQLARRYEQAQARDREQVAE